ncbi:MAG: hypothetical protein ACPGID_05845 [Rubricella sp.]
MSYWIEPPDTFDLATWEAHLERCEALGEKALGYPGEILHARMMIDLLKGIRPEPVRAGASIRAFLDRESRDDPGK